MTRELAEAMAKRREGKPLVEIAARECETFFEFIRVSPAGGTNIKINVQSRWKKECGTEERDGKGPPIRANFDDEVLRNISRSQLPVVRPQPRIDGESCEDRAATLVTLNFHASLSRSSFEKFDDRVDKSDTSSTPGE